jgi:membrane protease YdiL (CAAX protease family)
VNRKQSWIKRHPLVAFTLLAYGLSWVVQVPLALQALGLLMPRIPFALHYLSGFGPLLAAFIVTWKISGKEGLRELLGRLTKWEVGLKWWLIAISPLIALILLSLGMGLVGCDGPSVAQLGKIDHFPAIGLGTLALWLATFGLGEETGWRGFVLPRLQRGRSALIATIMLWVIWVFWHLPLFFYMYTFNILPGLLLGLLAGAIVFTWIYNSTGGSVLMTIIWHGLFNFATACTACKTGGTAAVISALVMVWAVLVVIIYKPATLSHHEKSILHHLDRSKEESSQLSISQHFRRKEENGRTTTF